jgi:SAM-dependent methyltransferase
MDFVRFWLVIILTGGQILVMSDMTDQKRYSPACERNKDVILDVLREVMPTTGTILEIACGPGQHAVHFASGFPEVKWQPSDIDPTSIASTRAWRDEAQLPNMLDPIMLDATHAEWPIAHANGIVCCNMIHISPWDVTLGLLDGAARILPDDGILYTYGPYKIGGKHTAPSNEAFDQSLRSQNPEWGVRNLDDVALEARRRGLHLVKTAKMPANNFSVIYKKTPMVDAIDV